MRLRNLIIRLLLGIIIYLSIELMSLISLTILREVRGIEFSPIQFRLTKRQNETLLMLLEDKSVYIQHDPDLGWSIKSNGISSNQLYKANAQGIRSNREHLLDQSPEIFRIATFGDSFTHCDDVSNEDTWQEYMMGILPSLEVMNFGVGGYGLDQAFLRYQRDGKQYRPNIIIIGLMSENINRHVNVFRPFYLSKTGLPFAKPRFMLLNNEITLIENPLYHLLDYRQIIDDPNKSIRNLGYNDWHFQQNPKESILDIFPSIRFTRLLINQVTRMLNPLFLSNGQYNLESGAYHLTVHLFDAFHQNALDNKSLPIIVLFPSMDNLTNYRENNTNVFQPLLQYFMRNRYRYVDLHQAFAEFAPDTNTTDLFTNGHYSPMANKIVAMYLVRYLKSSMKWSTKSGH